MSSVSEMQPPAVSMLEEARAGLDKLLASEVVEHYLWLWRSNEVEPL